MNRRHKKVPSYCLHKHSGQAVVRIGHRDHYLGPYGSPESHHQYERLLAEWRTSYLDADNGRQDNLNGDRSPSLSINKMILAYHLLLNQYNSVDHLAWPALRLTRKRFYPCPVAPTVGGGAANMEQVRSGATEQVTRQGRWQIFGQAG